MSEEALTQWYREFSETGPKIRLKLCSFFSLDLQCYVDIGEWNSLQCRVKLDRISPYAGIRNSILSVIIQRQDRLLRHIFIVVLSV
jgi:hypothetical protein